MAEVMIGKASVKPQVKNDPHEYRIEHAWNRSMNESAWIQGNDEQLERTDEPKKALEMRNIFPIDKRESQRVS